MRGQGELLHPKDVADELGIAVRTVLRWMRDGRLPHLDLGKLKRVRRSDLDQYLAAHRRPGRI